MLKFLEKIMTYGVFNDWRQVGMWQLDCIMRKLHQHKPLSEYTFAEKHAMAFFEKMADCFGPREVWRKPYGDELNEHRGLH